MKPRQHHQALSAAFSDSRLTKLHKSLCDRYLDKGVNLGDELFLAMKRIADDVVAEETTRSDAKRELMKLSVDDNDTAMVDMVYNCISGLPRFMTDANIGEFELITSFLDPILRPLFHDPDQMRLFCWTNRVCTEVEGNAAKRPDATMTLREQYHGASALGFCEVKPGDSAGCLTSTFTDLLRLGLFAKAGIDKEEIRSLMVVQAVGFTVTFYMVVSLRRQ